jgi:hypothetical protein
MPVISRLYGMIIKMFFIKAEHNQPHIHVVYGDKNCLINIKTLEVMEGDLPNKELNIIKEWLSKHQNELLDMWDTQVFKELLPNY